MQTILKWAVLAAAVPLWAQLSQSGGPRPAAACPQSAYVTISNSSAQPVVAAQAGKSIQVCAVVLNAGGNTSIRLVEGTGAQCDATQLALTPAFRFTNGSSIAWNAVMQLSPGRALCAVNSSNQDAHVWVTYARL